MLYLSKVAAVLATPLGFCLVLSLAGVALLYRGFRRTGVTVVAAAFFFLWVASMPLTARLALGALEARYPVLSVDEMPTADIAIVLGGAVEPPTPPRRAADLGDATDRIWFAAELFKAGKVQKILVSGGNLPWKAGSVAEAEAIRDMLIAWAVPAGAIIIESASRTTSENARGVKEMWPSLGASSALLVTSAAHMPRAMASFRRLGLPVTPAPTDLRSVQQPIGLLDLLPDAGALKGTSDALKEVVGYAVYWLRGDV